MIDLSAAVGKLVPRKRWQKTVTAQVVNLISDPTGEIKLVALLFPDRDALRIATSVL